MCSTLGVASSGCRLRHEDDRNFLLGRNALVPHQFIRALDRDPAHVARGLRHRGRHAARFDRRPRIVESVEAYDAYFPVRFAAAIASMAPSAMRSLAAKSASISGCACSMF